MTSISFRMMTCSALVAIAGCDLFGGSGASQCPRTPAPATPASSAPMCVGDAGGDDARDPIEEGVEVARADGMRVMRRHERGHRVYYAVWRDEKGAGEVALDGLVDTSPTFRVVDVNGDDMPDVLANLGKGLPEAGRFSIYESRAHAIAGAPDAFAWRYLGGAFDLDEVVTKLAKVRTDFSVPEVCGAIERARAPVDTWLREHDKWALSPKKRSASWSCMRLEHDGPGYWMPELRCSTIVPACEAVVISGGHGGTTRPDETSYFFERIQGKLELRALATDDH